MRSVGLSPLSPSITNDVNVSIATSLHQRLPYSGRVHHLSSNLEGNTQQTRQRQRQRLYAKRPACQSNQLTDASQNSLTVAELLRK